MSAEKEYLDDAEKAIRAAERAEKALRGTLNEALIGLRRSANATPNETVRSKLEAAYDAVEHARNLASPMQRMHHLCLRILDISRYGEISEGEVDEHISELARLSDSLANGAEEIHAAVVKAERLLRAAAGKTKKRSFTQAADSLHTKDTAEIIQLTQEARNKITG